MKSKYNIRISLSTTQWKSTVTKKEKSFSKLHAQMPPFWGWRHLQVVITNKNNYISPNYLKTLCLLSKFPRARYTKPGPGKIFLFLLDQCNDFQIQLFARMNSSISLLGERWDSLGWQTFPMVEMLPIIKSQHCFKQSHCQVSRLTLTMILAAFCSRHFAPPSENYENLWGAAGQSWFQSIEILKAITREGSILSDKYLPHSQIRWFTSFFVPPRPVA